MGDSKYVYRPGERVYVKTGDQTIICKVTWNHVVFYDGIDDPTIYYKDDQGYAFNDSQILGLVPDHTILFKYGPTST